MFARAQAAFAVASARSKEVFDPPDSYTLWRLPVEIEDQVKDAWTGWLEQADEGCADSFSGAEGIGD